MFVTTQAGRIVSAATNTLPPSATVDVGCDGLSVRMKIMGGDIIINAHDSTLPTKGYKAEQGEIFEFSGKASVYNGGSTDAEISVMVFDIV